MELSCANLARFLPGPAPRNLPSPGTLRGGPPDSIGWTALARFAGDTTVRGPFTSALDPDFAYQFTGTRLPKAPITVEDDVFITFESDGLANAPRNGGPAGFEIHWSIEGSGALCPEASCGHGTCVEGKCVCEPGYYGEAVTVDDSAPTSPV